MKRQFISAALTLSLAACSTVQQDEKPEPLPPIAVKSVVAANQQSNDIITLEKIMANPDWFGRAPESWYWGDDSNSVYFQQKKKNN